MRMIVGWIFFVLISFGAGLGIGLGISWGLLPTGDRDTAPVTLNQSDKNLFRQLIADSYYVTRDLARSKIRLELLDGDDALKAIQNQVEVLSLDGVDMSESNALSALYAAMINKRVLSMPTKILAFNATQASHMGATEITRLSVLSTLSAGDVITPTPSFPAGSLIIKYHTQVCDPAKKSPLLQVIVFDQSGRQLSGVVIIVESATGSERIITGLKPGMGAGYADYQLIPGVLYIISNEAMRGDPEKISVVDCMSPQGEKYPGGWLLEFQQ
jgi:hypothetical protein